MVGKTSVLALLLVVTPVAVSADGTEANVYVYDDAITIVVDVDQRPVNPLTLQAGGSVSIGRRWDVLLELGSNFDDAFVGVFSAAYRF